MVLSTFRSTLANERIIFRSLDRFFLKDNILPVIETETEN